MLNKEQADVVSNSLLAPYREEQTNAAQIQAKTRARDKARQRRWVFCFFGSAIGYGLGYLFTGNVVQTAFAGWVIGAAISYLLRDR